MRYFCCFANRFASAAIAPLVIETAWGRLLKHPVLVVNSALLFITAADTLPLRSLSTLWYLPFVLLLNPLKFYDEELVGLRGEVAYFGHVIATAGIDVGSCNRVVI